MLSLGEYPGDDPGTDARDAGRARGATREHQNLRTAARVTLSRSSQVVRM